MEVALLGFGAPDGRQLGLGGWLGLSRSGSEKLWVHHVDCIVPLWDVCTDVVDDVYI